MKHRTTMFYTGQLRTTLNSNNKKRYLEQINTYECYTCSKSFFRKKRYEDHMKACTRMPGVI